MTPEQAVAIMSAVVALIGALIGLYVQIAKLHTQVNGRLSDLLELTATSSLAEGKLAGPDTPPAGAEPPPLAPPSAP